MAIRIVKDLSATPSAIGLPGGLTLGQTLRTTASGPETVTIFYLLDGAHDVWFQRDDKLLSKSLRFEVTLDPAGTAFEHQATLVEGSGQGPTALVEIDERIETPSGIPMNSAVVVRIQ